MTELAGRSRRRPARALAGVALAVAALLAAPAGPLAAQEESESSLIKPLARRSLLLDGAAAGELMVAVGERGHLLTSRDDGESWQQQVVPTRATLTAVYFHDESLGWAVGHDATILRSRDGGATWELLHSAPEEERPFLDVWFRDADHGFAIGAYGYYLVTEDGGDSWSDRTLVVTEEVEPVDEEEDPYAYDYGAADLHLNAVSRSDSGRLYIAAEAGAAYRSDDDGATWIELPSPYEGSFFGSLPLDGDSVLLFGLRGHLFRSDDAGESWRAIETGTNAMLTDGTRLPDGTVVVAGLAGVLLVSRDGGATFELRQQSDRQGLAAILPLADGGLVLIGEHGVEKLPAEALAATR